jgi:glucokinase
MDAFLAYDIGGTKIRAGVVSKSGKVLSSKQVATQLSQGSNGFVTQIINLGKGLIESSKNRVISVGIASAGPLDPHSGVLLNPTNLSTQGRPWGKVSLTEPVQKALGLKTYLDNDAAAALLAESKVGSAKSHKNAMILTLGTGLGTAFLCNGKLVRSGRELHPEGGHLILNYQDASAPCGCGNLGCAEAYLSGRNFQTRFGAKYKLKWSAVQIADAARGGEKRAQAAFNEYSNLLSCAIHNYVVLFSPEIVILAGSFSKAHDCYLKQTRIKLLKLLQSRRVGFDLNPKIIFSKLNNESGLIGASFIGRHNI